MFIAVIVICMVLHFVVLKFICLFLPILQVYLVLFYTDQ